MHTTFSILNFFRTQARDIEEPVGTLGGYVNPLRALPRWHRRCALAPQVEVRVEGQGEGEEMRFLAFLQYATSMVTEHPTTHTNLYAIPSTYLASTSLLVVPRWMNTELKDNLEAIDGIILNTLTPCLQPSSCYNLFGESIRLRIRPRLVVKAFQSLWTSLIYQLRSLARAVP